MGQKTIKEDGDLPGEPKVNMYFHQKSICISIKSCITVNIYFNQKYLCISCKVLCTSIKIQYVFQSQSISLFIKITYIFTLKFNVYFHEKYYMCISIKSKYVFPDSFIAAEHFKTMLFYLKTHILKQSFVGGHQFNNPKRPLE